MTENVKDWEEFDQTKTFMPPERMNRRSDQLERKIREIFKLFERENNNMVDIREVGTMVRALGLNPTEEQLEIMIKEIEEQSGSTGFVKYRRDPCNRQVTREQFDQLTLDHRDGIHIVTVPDHPTPSKREGVSKAGIKPGMRLIKINGKQVKPTLPGGLEDDRSVNARLRAAEQKGGEPGQEQLELELEHKLFDPENAEPRRFFELMMETLLTHTFKPPAHLLPSDADDKARAQLMVRDSEDKIMRAFETLDSEKRGYIDSEWLKEMMTTRGEVFQNEEILEMLNAAADPETGYIKYDDYAPILATD